MAVVRGAAVGAPFGGGSADVGGGVARTFDQVGGGGGDRSGNRYDENGFGIANEGRPGGAQPSDGTQQPADTPITDFGTMEVVARRPDSTHTSAQTSRNIQGLFDPSTSIPVTDLGERVVVTAPRHRGNDDPPSFIPSNYDNRSVSQYDTYHPRECPYDPSVKTLETVIAEKPTQDELDAATNAAVDEALRRDQRWMLTAFSGVIGATYEGLRSLFNRDWLGAGLAAIGIVPIGRLTRVGEQVVTPVGEGMGFLSHKALRNYLKDVLGNKEMHHIVEQRGKNIEQFGERQIHNTINVIGVDKAMHTRISGYYSQIEPGTGVTRREMVTQWPYQDQYQYGLDKLRRFGVIE